jgi:hypothetical protein
MAQPKRPGQLLVTAQVDPAAPPGAGLTVHNVTLRYRVSEDKVRAWIKAGQLRAINTSSARCSRPRFVIPPEALSEFEQARSACPPPKPPRRRRRLGVVDFYPD